MKPTSISKQMENHAAYLLRLQGWNILAQNFRRIGCEIDIVAEKKETLIFLEVKFRNKFLNELNLLELLPPRKVRSLKKGANYFLTLNHSKSWQQIRFDLIVITKKSPATNELSYKYFDNVIC